MKCSTTAVSTEVLRRFALLLLALLLSSGHALTEDVAPAGEDIAAYINSGHYQFSLGGDAEWNSQIFINTANRGRLAINGNFNTIALRAGGISLLRDFTVDNDISITNTIFRPADPHPAANDYLIGIATANVNTTLRLAGTTFDGFNRTANRGASVLYAYANSTVNVYGGTSAANALRFVNNRSEWDAGGAVAVSSAKLYFNDYVTFENNYTGNYGGAITVYDFDNLLQFDGVTRFAGNHSSIFGGAIDVWGGAATVVFGGETTFEGNYVDYIYDSENSYETPRHVNDQHVRGGAINIGYISSAGPDGTQVTFNGVSRFANNYVISRGGNANNRNAMGGAISVYGNNENRNYQLMFNAAAVFDGNYVYSQNGQGHGGAIYYDTGGAVLTMVGGTRFTNNYASTHGGAIYLQAGTIELNALTDDIVFQGNRHGANFVQNGSTYQPESGSGTPNAIYLGSGGALTFDAAAGRTIHFYDPIASIDGSQVTVTKKGAGEVIFYEDNGLTDLYHSNIQANTTVKAGLFTLADGVEYGSANFGTFTVQDTGTVRGGGGGALNANLLAIQNGGALGASGGTFNVKANTITLADGARLTGYGTIASATGFAIGGTVDGIVAAGQNLVVDALLTGSGGIDVTGAGTLTLSRANTYTGATTVTNGTLAGGFADAFADSLSVTVDAGGTLDTNGFSQTANDLRGSGNIRLTDADLVAVMRPAMSQTFSGEITGTGGLGVRGGGTLIVSGNNSYSGTTSITEDSTIVATHGNALGSGLVLGLLGSTLELRYATDQTLTNRLAGGGEVVKTGAGTAHVTGGGSRIDDVVVTEGEFSLEQQGVFWTERYTTEGNAVTSIADGAKLYTGEMFTQAAGSTLNIHVGNNEPAITGVRASIDGTLNVTGFTAGPLASASQVDDVEYTIIRTSGGITGNFAVAAVDDSGITADYLRITGSLTNNNLEYAVGLGLTWNAATNALGTFTLTNADDAFDVDVALGNRGQSFPGWDGNSLIKQGPGTLTLSADNTYSGSTTIKAGTLAAGAVGVLDTSSAVSVAAGAKFDLNGYNQTVNHLSGAGSVILDGAVLTANYTSQNGTLSGSISGGGTLVKDGTGTLTLSGTNSQGGTVVRQGAVIATNAAAFGAGTVDIASAGRVDVGLAAAGTVANRFSGAGTLRNTGPGIATLTATGSEVGTVSVTAGGLAFGQNGTFNAGSYATAMGASTSIGATARLEIGGAFVQNSGSNLNVAVGQHQPVITANSAQLNGTLTVTGFDSGILGTASRINYQTFDVVKTTVQMAKGFDRVDIGSVADPADYLTITGYLREDKTVYSVGTRLKWFTGPETAHGDFTIAAGNVFDVDIDLDNQTGPFASGWTGRDLTKYGDGILVLSTVQKTYTGATTVTAGTLATTVANAFAASTRVDVQATGTLDLRNTAQKAQNLTGSGRILLGSGRLDVAASGVSEFSGSISGSGSIVKSGSGNFTLSGNNSFSGGTSVNQGTLTAGSASALGSGKATVANGAILQLNMGGDTSFANTLAGTGKLVQAGNNTVNLTAAGSSVGEVEVAAGGLTLAQNGTFTAGNYTTKNNALTTVNSGAQMVVTGQFTQEAGSALAVRIGASNDPAIRTGSATISGSLDISGFNNGALNRSSAIPTERYTVISSGTAIQGEFDPVTIDSTAPVDYLTVTGTFSSDRREYYVGMDLTWNASTDRANGTFNVANAFLVDTVLRDRSDETFDSLWSGQDLVKSGNDTLTLAAANTFEGTTTVEAGTLVLQTNNTIQYSSAVTVDTGATLAVRGTPQTANNLTGGGTVTLTGATLTSAYDTGSHTFTGRMTGTGKFIKTGTGRLTLSGANTHSGGTSVTQGELVASGNYAALGTGPVNIETNGILNLNFNGEGRIANQLSGGGQLVKTGTGLTTLTASGSSVGAVDVRQGTLALAQNGMFSAGSYVIDSDSETSIGGMSQLEVSGNFTMTDTTSTLSVTVGPGMANQPAVTAGSATLNGTLNLAGFMHDPVTRAVAVPSAQALTGTSYEVVRSTSVINGDFITKNIGTISDPVNYLTLEGNFGNGGKSYFVTFGLTWNASGENADGLFDLVQNDDRFVVDVVLENKQGNSKWNGNDLIKRGDGTLVLAESNTYDGSTTIEQGTLETGASNAFANSTSVDVQSGATLAMNGYSQKAQNLTGGGDITMGNGNAASVVLTAHSTNFGNPAFSGTISGNGSLVKTGAEDLTLSGRNTFTGTTRINEGTVVIQNGDALSRGTVTTASGTTLRLDFSGDESFYNRLDGDGNLTKTGTGVARLTGVNSIVTAVAVDAGELSFEQNGTFQATSLTTADNAITSVGPQSQLTLSGTLRQDGANAILNVTTSEDNEPVIQAERATLAGTLNIAGFSSQTYATASTLPSSVFNIIETNNGITGDFSRVVIGNTIDPIDYLAVIGGLSDNNKNYTVGVQLAWTANNEDATGTFTISGTDQFEVDVALQNQSLPSGNSWNGEDLTKKGTGTLVLSAGDTYNSKNSSRNTYTGVTDIQAGTLLTGDSNVFQNSSNIIVGQNAVLDMAGHDQSAKSLSGSGSILLGNGTLSVGSNEVGAGDSNFGGSIRGGGALRKIGNTTLTLSGTSEFSGGTEVSGGTLVLQAGSAAGTGVLNAANGTTVQLDIAANQTETFINRITGNGDLSKIGDGTALLTATNMEVADVDVREGTLALGSSANLNLTGTYTQENDTTLEIAIGTNEPAITADSANLDGDLVITGFDSSTYSSASSFLGRTFVVVDSVSNISGEFSNVTIANAGVEVDFLTIDGRINPDDDTEYIVGFGLQWYAGVPLSHGNFTIGPDDIFTLDQQLRDVQANTTTQWDGKSLTKLSGGTLVLAPDSGTGESHEYTGVTDIQAGTLRMGMENAIQESERVNVAGGGTFDLNGYDQNVKGISGTGTILLGNGELSVGANNPVSTDSTFAGAIRGDGSLRVTGGHTLTLSGRSDYTGGTTVADGTLVLQNGSAAGTGAINTAAGSTLNLAVDTTQTFANVLSGPGTVIKTGTGTAVLTGSDSTGTAVAGDVDVQTGSITLAQNGEFRAQSYHIHSKAGTSISADASMRLEDEFVQESGATLGVALGADPDTAKITAGTADIAGAIYVTGFDATALPASVLTANRHTVLETTQANGITGDFSSVDFGGQLASVDYLVLNGTLNNTQDKYTVGFDLAWYAGPAEGTGSFTIADGTGFEVDVLLEDRDPAIPFASGWNGRDLTKNGDGTLTLSHANTYSGATTVTGGTLRLTETNALGRSNSLTMADGATVDIQSSSQTVGVLDSQTGSVLNLNDGGLVLDSNQSEGGRRDNVIDGTLQGNGTLSLTDADLTVTSDNADYRGDVVASLRSASGSTITLNNVHGLGDSGNLFFNRSEDSLVFAEAAGTGAFSKRMHGEGSVTLEDGTDVTISGNNVNFGGAFTVDDGATMRAGAADNLGTAGIRVNGALHLSSAADASWRLENTVTGAGDFVKDGDGRLVLGTSMSDFTGDARVAAGTLVVGDGTDVDAVLGSLQVEVDEGASLSGTGTVDGAVHNRGSIASLNAIAGYERAAPSNLTIGPLTNAGTIRLAGNAVGNTLTVRGGMRSENGVLEINTVFGDDSSPTDKLILDGGVTTGSTGVIVHNRGGTGAETDVGIMIVEAANGATTSPDSFALSSQARNFRAGVGTMAAGAFDYSLLRGGNGGDENSWYLVSRRVARPEAGNYLVAREAAEGLFFHSMFDRLLGYQEYVVPTTGERRLHSAWARMQYGRATQDNCLTGLNSSSNTFVAQTGMDLWRAESNLGAFFAGAMIGFGTASGTITDASIPLPAKSNLDGYLVGGYATWFMDRQRVDGLYVDGWVQHAWFKNRTSGAGLPGERFTTRLWSGSLEAGYAIPLFRTANSAWTVTPTVQLTYNSYKANNFVEATGTEIKFTDRDRFFTTAGFRVKGTVGAPGRLQSEPYVEFKWLRKGKKTRIRMDDHSLSLGSPRNLYEAKLGIDMPIRDTLRVGVNVSGQFGKGNYRRLAGEIGLRLDW